MTPFQTENKFLSAPKLLNYLLEPFLIALKTVMVSVIFSILSGKN